MRKAYEYSHLGGAEILRERYPLLDQEIDEVIGAVKPLEKTKISMEKAKKGRALWSPKLMNRLFEAEFRRRGWNSLKSRFVIEIEGLERKK